MGKRPEQGQSDEEEIIGLSEALEPYLKRYMLSVARAEAGKIDPKSPEHPNNMRRSGLEIRLMRRSLGLLYEEVAEGIGVDPVQLRAFEGGLIPSADLPKGFARDLSMFLRGALTVSAKLRGQSSPGSTP